LYSEPSIVTVEVVMNGHRIKWLATPALVVSMVVTSIPTVGAQSASVPPLQGAPVPAPLSTRVAGELFTAGVRAGEAEAEKSSTGGKIALGALAGATIWGTLGVFALQPAPLTVEAFEHYSTQPSEFQDGFKEGWRTRSHAKKRRAFLFGAMAGFLGTWVVAASASR
jgi:hypothetical protein